MAPASARSLPSLPLIEQIARARVQGAGHVRHRDLGRAGRASGCRRTSSTSSCRSTRRASSTRFLDHWRPDLALFIESDLWPNLIIASAERGIPLILVNGRMSERSFTRWRRVPANASRRLLGRFDLCLAQSAADAERYAELGAPRVSDTGNLKLDVPAPPADPEQARRAPGRDRRPHRSSPPPPPIPAKKPR